MEAHKAYSTLHLPPHRQLGAWQDYMADVYYNVEIQPIRKGPVRGELQKVSFHPMGLSRFRADAQKCFRHRDAARQDRDESFVFIFPTRGAMHFSQGGGSGTVPVGDVVMLNSAEAYGTEVPDDAANITIKVPCSILRDRLPGVDDLCARAQVANAHLAPVARHLATELLSLGHHRQGGRLRDGLVDMLCLMLDIEDHAALSETDLPTPLTLMYKTLRHYLAVNFHDPELSPTGVAHIHRISVRYLHKVFSENKTTFGRTLLSIRLSHARRELASTPAARRNIASIAYSCGFSSQAHFSVRFRETFGFSPRETP